MSIRAAGFVHARCARSDSIVRDKNIRDFGADAPSPGPATRYKRVLGNIDPVEAFQHAYAGLESLEKPLADELGIPAGSETVSGTCKSCGASYEYKKSVLAGVRSFVNGTLHNDYSDRRSEEWRDLSNLRHALFHGFTDLEQLTTEARDLLATVCHYLHDASAHLAHLHALESETFHLSRFGKWFVIRGRAHLESFPNLLNQTVLLEAEPMRWVQHVEHGLIPEYEVENLAGGPVEGDPFVLQDFGNASEEDLVSAKWMFG